jgi:hypothetical protein
VVLQVPADLRTVGDRHDQPRREVLGRPDPGQHQELRRQVGAGRDDHLTGAVEAQGFAAALALDADRAEPVEDDSLHLDACLDRQVGTAQHRMQERHRRRAAAAVALRQLVVAHPVLGGGVEVVVRGQARGDPGLDHRVHHRVRVATFAHRQRPAGAVVLVGAALVVLGALEVGKEVGVAPAVAAGVAPAVVVGGVAADVDHRVGGRRAAESLPAWQVDAASIAVGLVAGPEIPVDRGARQRGDAERDVDVVERVGGTRFDQEDVDVLVLAQSCGKYATCRPCPHHDVVVH